MRTEPEIVKDDKGNVTVRPAPATLSMSAVLGRKIAAGIELTDDEKQQMRRLIDNFEKMKIKVVLSPEVEAILKEE